MEIQCSFKTAKFFDKHIYNCLIKNQQIPKDQELKFIGQHERGKTNNDVLSVQFNNCTVTKIPQGITKIFPNLKILQIWSSKLINICKNDLVEYKNLETFSFENNEIEFLPGDLFEGFKNLKYICFYNNKLNFIEPNILDGLEKLKYVYFSDIPNYEKCYSVYSKYDSNATLDEVKLELFEKYPKKYEFFKDLRTENQQLKESKLKLETELDQEKLKNSELTDKNQTGLFDSLKNFIQDETTKDFRIQIDDHEFPVHKFLLAARSPTLAEILKNNPEVENLNLVDISVEIFEIILKFLYTDELPGDDETNFLHLFAATGKLKIDELRNFAANKLINLIDENNAIEVFKLSNKYEHDELKQKAFNELRKCYPNYKFKDEWITKAEVVVKAIERFKKAEEEIRKFEEELTKCEI